MPSVLEQRLKSNWNDVWRLRLMVARRSSVGPTKLAIVTAPFTYGGATCDDWISVPMNDSEGDARSPVIRWNHVGRPLWCDAIDQRSFRVGPFVNQKQMQWMSFNGMRLELVSERACYGHLGGCHRTRWDACDWIETNGSKCGRWWSCFGVKCHLNRGRAVCANAWEHLNDIISFKVVLHLCGWGPRMLRASGSK